MEIIGYELLNEIEGFDCKKGDIIKNKDYFTLYKKNKDFKAIYKETMEKEIIGYKLKKDCKQYEESAVKIIDSKGSRFYGTVGSPLDIETLRKAGVLDLWFEPVYKEESFKKGDYIVITESDLVSKGNYFHIGGIYKLTEDYSETNGSFRVESDDRYIPNGYSSMSHNYLTSKYDFIKVRKATEEEILSVTRKELLFGDVKFSIDKGDDFAITQYGKVTKKEIDNAIYYIENPPCLTGYKLTIHAHGECEVINEKNSLFKIGFGCKSGDLDELKAILKAFD